jgi:hypothetical protein
MLRTAVLIGISLVEELLGMIVAICMQAVVLGQRCALLLLAHHALDEY